jgi:hypothetical protein
MASLEVVAPHQIKDTFILGSATAFDVQRKTQISQRVAEVIRGSVIDSAGNRVLCSADPLANNFGRSMSNVLGLPHAIVHKQYRGDEQGIYVPATTERTLGSAWVITVLIGIVGREADLEIPGIISTRFPDSIVEAVAIGATDIKLTYPESTEFMAPPLFLAVPKVKDR